MLNRLQYLLYNLGLIAPVIIINSIIFLLCKSNYLNNSIIALLLISIVIFIYHLLFLNIIKNKIATINISIKNVPEEADDIGKKIWLAYITPLIGAILKTNNDIPLSYLVIGIEFIWIYASNQVYISPIYKILGFHYYKIESKFGKKYILISKKEYFCNTNQVQTVKVVFENFLLHEE